MNKKKQLAYYRDKTNEISKQLSASNQKYFEDLREYLLFLACFKMNMLWLLKSMR